MLWDTTSHRRFRKYHLFLSLAMHVYIDGLPGVRRLDADDSRDSRRCTKSLDSALNLYLCWFLDRLLM